MKKRLPFLKTLLILSLCSPLLSEAQSSCDTCGQLSTLNSSSEEISTNTNNLVSLLQQLLETVTRGLFGTFYDMGNTMSAFTAIPATQNNAYTDQQALLHTLELTYQGSSSENATLTDNYAVIFNNYLLTNGATFDANNASIASLYLNPSSPGFYSEEQKMMAQRYIALASGAAVSTARKPSSSWLSVGTKNPDYDKRKIRERVANYYTYSAIESAIADNFTYIYGLNTGQALEGTLDNYSNSMISESGLLTYILSQKALNEDWYTQIKNMGVIGLLREQTVLLGGSFLMLSRIEEDLRRILITNSTQATLSLMGAQTLNQMIAQMPKPAIPSS